MEGPRNLGNSLFPMVGNWRQGCPLVGSLSAAIRGDGLLHWCCCLQHKCSWVTRHVLCNVLITYRTDSGCRCPSQRAGPRGNICDLFHPKHLNGLLRPDLLPPMTLSEVGMEMSGSERSTASQRARVGYSITSKYSCRFRDLNNSKKQQPVTCMKRQQNIMESK